MKGIVYETTNVIILNLLRVWHTKTGFIEQLLKKTFLVNKKNRINNKSIKGYGPYHCWYYHCNTNSYNNTNV